MQRVAVPRLSPVSLRGARAGKAEHSSSIHHRGCGSGWNELVPICNFSACREKSWHPRLWHTEPGAFPPHMKCDSSTARDAGQGSAGFSSFDGHETQFDTGQGLVFIFFSFFFPFSLLFFLSFFSSFSNLLLALGLLRFGFFSPPKDDVFVK